MIAAAAGLLFLLAAAYFLLLIRPRKRKEPPAALLCPYAHRGLHSETVPENSMAAFERACREGYGIELDVQLSADGEVMVFHDYTLIRMTGREGKLSDLTAAELKTLSLKDTAETIPTFREVLELVGGRVPLLVELKGEDLNASLCPKVAALLGGYEGDYCIESFNPLLLRAMRKELPGAYYGQLYTNVCKDKKRHTPLNVLLTLMAFNFLAHPHFIAYNQAYRHSLPVRITTGLYRAPRFVWTVRTAHERDALRTDEHPIFEGEGSPD